ncbi:carbohydrate ABC transporter permease [Paenibacillus radicis (ex Xue et al. 2023)]|uniref:Sugar ABC transporter permease n=1 Tax=Paenibacillus radicis (ex Xue et al. 2023) TaxID=2972489 RepID=A0ABT1YU40_9BACL|nr:sugar ABC transporter permease [Paenibacillus radicis (ex Xue et al. 2023)]MCR8635505.1 sugar ABC transporter permease [Paenibacillus radicis (ex Xue et al. 2023)]
MSLLKQDLGLPSPTEANARQHLTKAQSLRNLRFRENLLACLFLAPSLLLFGIFLFYPLVKSVYLSLHLTDPRGRIAAYVGLENFQELFLSEKFYQSLKVTLSFTLLTVPTCILIALLLAALTHNKLRGMRAFQFIFSLPIAISVGTGSVIWMMLYHPSVGILNYFLSLVGIQPIGWLTDPAWALVSISIMTVWMNLGFNYIVLLSGLQGVSEDIYDSAKIDGSGPVRTFVQLTLPLVSPTLFFVFIVSVIGAFQSFGQIHILTRGGPMNTTDVVVYNIYQDAFINFRFGIGSAQALVLFAIILVLTLLQFKVFEKKVHYQ